MTTPAILPSGAAGVADGVGSGAAAGQPMMLVHGAGAGGFVLL